MYAGGEEYYGEVKEIGSWQWYQAMTNMAPTAFNYTLYKTSARCRHYKPRMRIWKHCILQSFCMISSVHVLLLLLLFCLAVLMFVVVVLLLLILFCFIVVVFKCLAVKSKAMVSRTHSNRQPAQTVAVQDSESEP